MKTHKIAAFSLNKSKSKSKSKTLTLAALFAFSGTSFGQSLSPLVDDFSDAKNNSLGIQRQFINDTVAGGKTTTQQSVSQGVISIKGKLDPARGQPGWASTVLPLGDQNQPQDASAFEGIRLLVKINSGSFTVSANSTKITNFDYHAAPIATTADVKFHEVKFHPGEITEVEIQREQIPGCEIPEGEYF